MEKIDAEPEEEDDSENRDETSDFTLFDVSLKANSINPQLISLQLKVSKDDTTLIDSSTENFSATTYSFGDDWGKF